VRPLESLLARLGRPLLCDALFDGVPDTVFFVKDAAGRYVAANQVLAERTGLGRKDALIGRTADEVFPGELGRRFAAQDRAILRSARGLRGELELHIHADGREGWCLTWKEPLLDPDRAVAGLIGLSRDLRAANAAPDETAALSRALHAAQERPDTCRTVGDLAAAAGLTPFRLDGRIRAMFGISARQYLTRLRIDWAGARLRQSDDPISQIALDSGYGDQTAFARQFRKRAGLSPGAYRKLHGRTDSAPRP
jgi:PAS domain S-box-containing protein